MWQIQLDFLHVLVKMFFVTYTSTFLISTYVQADDVHPYRYGRINYSSTEFWWLIYSQYAECTVGNTKTSFVFRLTFFLLATDVFNISPVGKLPNSPSVFLKFHFYLCVWPISNVHINDVHPSICLIVISIPCLYVYFVFM